MDLAEGAAAWRRVAERAEESLAVDCAKAAAKEFRAALDITVPVLSGDLRDSMHVFSVEGDGEHAIAIIGSELIYAKFRNDGGTITRKKGRPAVLGTPATGFFGKGNPATVTQVGSQYMQRAEEWSDGPLQAAIRGVVVEYFTI
jgi:phage gpG-like protein